MMCAVRALNSYIGTHGYQLRRITLATESVFTLQKSIDLTPLLPSAGPTGGLGEAFPASTMSLTIWSAPAAAERAFDILELSGVSYVKRKWAG